MSEQLWQQGSAKCYAKFQCASTRKEINKANYNLFFITMARDIFLGFYKDELKLAT